MSDETNDKDVLPKGRVNEVCKEWLIREDSALAYQLQSKEIREHLQGNKFRNSVVRQDFPTALTEQLKEKEEAERRAALYHQMINEQEQTDARVARELAKKLENELNVDGHRKKAEYEFTNPGARHSNELLTGSDDGARALPSEAPIPPRNLKPKQYRTPDLLPRMPQQDHQNASPVRMALSTSSPSPPQLNYVSLDLNSPGPSDRKHGACSQYAQIRPQNFSPTNFSDCSDSNLYTVPLNLNSHTPEKDFNRNLQTNIANRSQVRSPTYDNSNNSHYESVFPNACELPLKYTNDQSPMNNEIAVNVISHIHMLSPEKYDKLMGNHSPPLPVNQLNPDECDGAFLSTTSILFSAVPLPNSAGPNAENSTDNYRNGDRTLNARVLEELGLPKEEIDELNRRVAQEKRDEQLARMLQQTETVEMSQEEKDRMLAMEAQDKELAKMLQEREKAKAKRAKEKSKIKKQQQDHDKRRVIQGQNDSNQMAASHTRQFSLDSQEDSNSVPTKYRSPCLPALAPRGYPTQEPPRYPVYSDENYSNPLDMIRREPTPNQWGNQRSMGSEDNIYTQPVSALNSGKFSPDQQSMRPTYLNLDNVTIPSNINVRVTGPAQVDPMYNDGARSPTPEYIDKISTSPVPPYMPIQGTRRNPLPEIKKKKSKETKCAQQ